MFKKIVWLWFSTKGKNKKATREYIDSLVASWAGEFFTGYNPPYWSDKFGFEVSPNWRFAEHEQITDLETLEEIIEAVHAHDLEIFINLNAWYYTPETFPLIERMVWEFLKIGVDGIICGNIAILEYLKNMSYSGKINISTILAAYNSEAIKFYLDNYNINKVILSREVTLKEMEVFVWEFPDVKFEVFWEGDFCRYNNGLCYAEHKYWAKDICTVVVNDLVINKKFKPDFKKIIIDESKDNEEKINILTSEYKDYSEHITEILQLIELDVLDSTSSEALYKELLKIIWKNRTRVDLFFDAMKPLQSERNQKIIIFLSGLKKLLEYFSTLEEDDNKKNELEELKKELEASVHSWVRYLTNKTKKVWWSAKLKALELANFYAKGDNLNLYNYIFIEKYPNLDTVKFPTRWRNYSEKIAVIEKVLQEWVVWDDYIDRWTSIERAHYDLTYLFDWDKLWFRKMLQKK